VALFIIPIVFIRLYAPQKYLAATALGGVCVASYNSYRVMFLISDFLCCTGDFRARRGVFVG
jgi:hypothetical protein